MSLSTDDAARLATLRGVRDKLMTGQVAERVSYNGFDTTFTKADMNRIDAEIERLERLDAGKCAKGRGAFRFTF